MQRYNKPWNYHNNYDNYFNVNVRWLFEQLQLGEAVLVADDKGDGRVLALDEVVQIERFAQDEKAGDEGVSFLQFRVLGLFHDEMRLALAAERTAAVGFPGDEDPVAGLQVCGVDVRGQDGVGIAALVQVQQEFLF